MGASESGDANSGSTTSDHITLANRDVEIEEEAHKWKLSESPENGGLHNSYGNLLQRIRRTEEAQKEFELAIDCYERRDGPNDDQSESIANCRINLGALYMSCDKMVEGYQQFKMAVELDPSNPSAHINCGAALLQRDDLEGAEKHIRKALELLLVTVISSGESQYDQRLKLTNAAMPYYYMADILVQRYGNEVKMNCWWRRTHILRTLYN